jgi:hypothetical protein
VSRKWIWHRLGGRTPEHWNLILAGPEHDDPTHDGAHRIAIAML